MEPCGDGPQVGVRGVAKLLDGRQVQAGFLGVRPDQQFKHQVRPCAGFWHSTGFPVRYEGARDNRRLDGVCAASPCRCVPEPLISHRPAGPVIRVGPWDLTACPTEVDISVSLVRQLLLSQHPVALDSTRTCAFCWTATRLPWRQCRSFDDMLTRYDASASLSLALTCRASGWRSSSRIASACRHASRAARSLRAT